MWCECRTLRHAQRCHAPCPDARKPPENIRLPETAAQQSRFNTRTWHECGDRWYDRMPVCDGLMADRLSQTLFSRSPARVRTVVSTTPGGGIQRSTASVRGFSRCPRLTRFLSLNHARERSPRYVASARMDRRSAPSATCRCCWNDAHRFSTLSLQSKLATVAGTPERASR